MQLHATSTTPAPTIAAAPAAAAPELPTFGRALDYFGGGRYATFSADPSSRPYGKAEGYGSLQDAIDALQEITVGAKHPAAGIFEADGRFHARALYVRADFDDQLGGLRGPWLLEEHPNDVPSLGDNGSGDFGVNPALKAIVDGAVVFDPANFTNG